VASISLRNLDKPIADEFSRLRRSCFGVAWAAERHSAGRRGSADTPLGDSGDGQSPSPLAREGYELRIGAKATLTAKDMQVCSGVCRRLSKSSRMLLNVAACRTAAFWIGQGLLIGASTLNLARGDEYRPEFMRKVVERLAYFKINMLHLYLEK